MYHPRHHQERPDLDYCVLESRTLPASFLASTFYEPPAFSETTPVLGGMNPAIDGANDNVSWGGYFIAPTNSASYYGFGSNPFGLGLSPLSGVVSAYSINSALSNILGAGSSMPGSEQTIVTAGLSNPLGLSSIPTTSVRGLSSTITTGPTAGYGSAFSTGFNFGINSTNSFGMGPNVVGNMAAATANPAPLPPFDIGQTEPGSEPNGEPGSNAQAPERGAPKPSGVEGAPKPNREPPPARGQAAPIPAATPNDKTPDPDAAPDAESMQDVAPWDPGLPDR